MFYTQMENVIPKIEVNGTLSFVKSILFIADNITKVNKLHLSLLVLSHAGEAC
jgi:hypothetical protein